MSLFLVFSPQVAVQEDSRGGWERAGPECSLCQSRLFRWIREGEWELKVDFSALRRPWAPRRTALQLRGEEPRDRAESPPASAAVGSALALC